MTEQNTNVPQDEQKPATTEVENPGAQELDDEQLDNVSGGGRLAQA